MGDQPVARPLPTHRITRTQTKAHRHLCLEWHWDPQSQRSSGDSSCLRQRDHCDQILNCSYNNKITFKNFRTRKQVVRSGRVCLVRREGILTAIQRNAIRIRKITVGRNCLGLVDISFRISPSLQNKSFERLSFQPAGSPSSVQSSIQCSFQSDHF
jgi:hypothetical protein